MISQIADAPASARGIELSELVSFLAYEVRGPLSVILGNALLLQRGRCGDEEARDGLEDIRQEAEKLRRITDGLFSLAQEAPEFEPLAVGLVVEKVVELFRRRHPGRTISLSVHDHLWTLGIQAWVEETTENLLSNADKYSPLDQSIDVEVYGLCGSVATCVADRGPGVPEHDQQRIFDLFARLAPKGPIPGLGIGLSLCKRLAELMDGEVRCNNRPGGGSCFSLILPRYDLPRCDDDL